jgi:hypothetical protein
MCDSNLARRQPSAADKMLKFIFKFNPDPQGGGPERLEDLLVARQVALLPLLVAEPAVPAKPPQQREVQAAGRRWWWFLSIVLKKVRRWLVGFEHRAKPSVAKPLAQQAARHARSPKRSQCTRPEPPVELLAWPPQLAPDFLVREHLPTHRAHHRLCDGMAWGREVGRGASVA